MSPVYSLYPGIALRAARTEFADYEIVELHDHTGCAEYTAVLKEPYRTTGSAVLVSAGSVGELVSELRDQGSPPFHLAPSPRAVPSKGGRDAA